MRLSDLETFVTAVQEGSLTGAARRLFITQPAASARLRRLEAEVKEPLLRRSRQGVRMTAAGERLYSRARNVLAELHRLEQEVGEAGAIRGRLSVGATDLVAIYHLPALLKRFRSRHPQVELALHVDGTAPLLRMLDAGQVELLLATLAVPEGPYESFEFYRDPLVVVDSHGARRGRGKRPSTPRGGIEPAALADQVWISYKPDSVTRQLVEGFFVNQGIHLRIEMETSNPEAIKKMVQARLGLAVLPWCSVGREVADGRLATLPVRGFDLARTSGLILRRGTPLSRAAEAFRALLMERRRPVQPS